MPATISNAASSCMMRNLPSSMPSVMWCGRKSFKAVARTINVKSSPAHESGQERIFAGCVKVQTHTACNAFGGVFKVTNPRFNRGHQFVRQLLAGGSQKLRVCAEVVIKGAARHGGGGNDVIDHAGVDPFFGKHQHGTFYQPPTHPFALFSGSAGSVVRCNLNLCRHRHLLINRTLARDFDICATMTFSSIL
jgi:hypothetical protein